eukprot:gene10623-11748_t
MSKFDPVTVTVQPDAGGKGGQTVIPIPEGWLPPPPIDRVPVNCLPGLEHLATMDQIFINQRINWMEICFGCEFNQRYNILDPMSGKQLYYASEDSGFCTRYWCGTGRPLQMGVYDFMGKEVLHMSRPFRCAGMMLPPCLDEFTITSSDGRLLGTVKQTFAWCLPRFDVLDHNGQVIFNIKGPCCHCSCNEVPFKIYSVGESTECGVIAKRWTGFAKECCTDVDNFRIQCKNS